MGKCRHLVVPRFGPRATEALARLVADAQRDDPLAPVDVVTLNAVSGMTLRRAIANPALANVRFASLPQLAERLALRRLATDGLRPLRRVRVVWRCDGLSRPPAVNWPTQPSTRPRRS